MSEFVKGLQGVVAGQSKIGFIDGEKGILAYMGYPIDVLAQNSTYEETAYLLLYGKLPNKKELAEFDQKLKAARHLPAPIVEMIQLLPKSTHPMETLQTIVSALGAYSNGDSLLDRSIKLIAQFPIITATRRRVRLNKSIVTPKNDLSHAANFLYMLTGEQPDAETAKMFDVCLILHAEHSFNASTFTGRVVASTMTTLHSSVSAAIGALYGPLHGGANEKVLHAVEEIGKPEKARQWVMDKFSNKEKIMGMGHRVYKVKDPRAFILEDMLKKLTQKRSDTNIYDTLKTVEETVRELMEKKGKDIWPNVDFFSGALYTLMQIPADLFTPVFAISRAAGWCAHIIEQLEDNRIFRPKCEYIGQTNQSYIAISDR
jgi:citrate synthase